MGPLGLIDELLSGTRGLLLPSSGGCWQNSVPCRCRTEVLLSLFLSVGDPLISDLEAASGPFITWQLISSRLSGSFFKAFF